MAKRRVKAGTRKAGRKTSKKATRKASRPARKASAQKAKSRQSSGKSGGRRRTARPKRARRAFAPPALQRGGRARAKARRRFGRFTHPRAARRRTGGAPSASARGSVESRKTTNKRPRLSTSRPKPVALSRERRQLREDEAIPGAPSTLNFAVKASAAESGHQMYHQRAKEHTEGGQALTGGDVDSDWNDAYASGEETPGGDMSTPDQDVVEEIGRALGVEYEDAEELKGRRENREPRPQPMGVRPGERRRLQGPKSPRRLRRASGLTAPSRRKYTPE